MSLLLRTNFEIAKNSLKKHKFRSFFTCFGISVGIGSIILILSLAGSISQLISSQVKALNQQLILVRPANNKNNLNNIIDELTNSNHFNNSNLTAEDLVKIKESSDNIKNIAPIATLHETTTGDHIVESATILATTSDLKSILNLDLKSGNFIQDNDLKSAVIGHSLALQLFGSSEPIGKTFSFAGHKFIIIGTLQKTENPVNFNGVDFDQAVIVDLNQIKNLNPQIQQINITVKDDKQLDSTAEKITKSLTNLKGSSSNFTVNYGSHITHPASNFFSIISIMLGSIAAISLFIGGISVMNLMLVSVTERTHEIGIRKAIGATNTHIFMQFLFESIILVLVGCIGGFLLGYLIAIFCSTFTPFKPFISLEICLVAFYFAFVTGILFGLFPAIKASKQKPIDSLKFSS
jgi:ABC superfamily ATP binding cassette transporter, membrane protein